MTTQPDPVFAAIEDFRPYGEALKAACNPPNDEAYDIAAGPAYDRLRAIYEMEPQSPAGLLAIMKLMVEWDGDHLRLTEEARRSRSGPDNELDDAEWGLIAVFRHAQAMLETMT